MRPHRREPGGPATGPSGEPGDVPGVLDKSKNLIADLSVTDARKLIADGTISGGMIPKVETCVNALRGGVKQAHILDGRIPHVLLIETFTEHGASTMIRA